MLTPTFTPGHFKHQNNFRAMAAKLLSLFKNRFLWQCLKITNKCLIWIFTSIHQNVYSASNTFFCDFLSDFQTLCHSPIKKYDLTVKCRRLFTLLQHVCRLCTLPIFLESVAVMKMIIVKLSDIPDWSTRNRNLNCGY